MNGSRVAIVTGGTRGISASITERMVDDGSHVVAVYTRNDATAGAFRARMARRRGSVETVATDIGDPAR